MDWTQFLKDEVETTFNSTERLLAKVDPGSIGWKPATGSNWMTVGQLLRHIGEGCGGAFRGFITGNWGMPEGMKIEDLTPEQMLPPAEQLPSVDTVDAANKLLAADKALALRMLEKVTPHELEHRKLAAPWAPGVERTLGLHLHQMVQHLDRHRSQLFYYLKLQGKPVNTADLWD